ncbi:MAG: hypothetical protein AABZ33_09290 [Chloroflexota bacterium]
MPTSADLIPLSVAGVAVGLLLLWRGFTGYRTAARIGGTSTSRIASIAAGEVRISGTVEAAEVALVSPLQSATSVYYRARISAGSGTDNSTAFDEERAVGFAVRDGTGAIRVFPRGARWDVPWRFDASDDWTGSRPDGLALRDGPAYTAARPDREARIAALLTVRIARDPADPEGSIGGATGFLGASVGLCLGTQGERPRRYTEARIEPGDSVTILGRAIPFGTLGDPAHADLAEGGGLDEQVEAEISADIAEARAAGLLAPDAETAWGNAAIPGFGIGRPAREPAIDPRADAAPLAGVVEAEAAERTFTIPPEALVVVASSEVPLLIAAGAPGAAGERQQTRFLVGLLGAALAIGSAVVLALGLGATLP